MRINDLVQNPYFIAFAILFVVVIYCVLRSPFRYPYFKRYIDVSGRRNPQMTELIDEYLIQHRMSEIDAHKQLIERWKADCRQQIATSLLRQRRQRQFEAAIDDARAYVFVAYRMQTRYSQKNYVKSSYQVENVVLSYAYDYFFLANRNAHLAQIGYETTLSKYSSKQQRKLMTPQLRRQIIIRDNYTCQICGKQMFDEVGLEVDHIIPVSRGGKTIPSNLQVLCSKCNRRKHNRQATI